MPGSSYQKELVRLRELAPRFSDAWPALAPMLAGPTTDPDAERLLEGVAFKIGLMRERLESDFPEIVHEYFQRLLPHYLLPFPAATIVSFSLDPSALESCVVPAGTRLSSIPLDGTSCVFSTTSTVEVHPLRLTDASLSREKVSETAVVLSLESVGMPLSQWRPGPLRIHVTGDYVPTTDLFLLLSRHVRSIVLTPARGGSPFFLPPDSLRPVGLEAEDSPLPYPPNAFPGFRLLREYFAFREKFPAFDLYGLDLWRDRGDGTGFLIRLELDHPPGAETRIGSEHFALFATPAVNIFPHEADPIVLDHRSSTHLLRPAAPNPAHYRIFSVDGVSGFFRRTGRERRYAPLDLFREVAPEQPVYHAVPVRSQVHAGYDLRLSVGMPLGGALPEEETLSIQLTCTNGVLPEGLRIGDVSELPPGLPDSLSVRNITPIRPGTFPPLEPDLPERLTRHLYLNCLTLGNGANLRSLLELYVFSGNRSRASSDADLKRIAGIEEVTVLASERWVNGVPMTGREVRVKVRRDHFAGPGDLYLFGCVLDRFMAECAEPNTFTVLIVQESIKGGGYQWPPRLGRKPLR
ncbi:MAG: type VI secretion system baseplate subunit TssF [Geobacteraceae bacterium]|nr:type VI secretion system baseplate subunit TssF [Geobacteraceae bacterium]